MTEHADLHEVKILGLPLDIWEHTQEHIDGLRREFTLIVSDTSPDRHIEPRELLDVIAELERDYEGMTTNQEEQLVAAVESDTSEVDLTFLVPSRTADDCRRLDEVLDAADRYCREGEYLLSLATPPDALAFRRWYLNQFIDQLSGGAPVPWPEWATTNFSDWSVPPC